MMQEKENGREPARELTNDDAESVRIEIMSAEEAAEKLRALGMRISPDTVRRGMRQGVFPFGSVIEGDEGSIRCYVYARLFREWVAERC